MAMPLSNVAAAASPAKSFLIFMRISSSLIVGYCFLQSREAGTQRAPRDPQILCYSAEPLLTSPLVGRSDGEQCQHANSAGRNLPPSFRTHAARQWQ